MREKKLGGESVRLSRHRNPCRKKTGFPRDQDSLQASPHCCLQCLLRGPGAPVRIVLLPLLPASISTPPPSHPHTHLYFTGITGDL